MWNKIISNEINDDSIIPNYMELYYHTKLNTIIALKNQMHQLIFNLCILCYK